MSDHGIELLGIPIPSSSWIFLACVAIHVAAGLTSVVAGAVAMLAPKAPGRHPRAGTIYYRGLVVVVLTMTVLTLLRWPADLHLFALGGCSFLAGWFGRRARRRSAPGWAPVHVIGMALSYILLLTAFYVDNGPHLPGWRALPPIAFWLLPGAIGGPILGWALLRHPLLIRLRREGAGHSSPPVL